jgi:hypothetical protein
VPKEILDRRRIGSGVLIPESGGHPLANFLKDPRPGQEFLLRGDCSGSKHTLPIEVIH